MSDLDNISPVWGEDDPVVEHAEEREITLPPRRRPTAYFIDPLMARSWEMRQVAEPCRVDGEISGAEVWKWTAKHRIARILGPLAVLALVFIPFGHDRTADAHPARVSADVTTVVQACLHQFGYGIDIDGVYGPQTTRAVRHWQKANGLHQDGIAGPRTISSINRAGCGVFPPAGTPIQVVTPSGSGVDRWHDLAIRAGWTEAQWPTVRCIIHRESRGQPNAHNSAGATGLMQILQRYHPGVNLFDPYTNLATGVKLYRIAGWQPWVAPPGVKDCF